MSEKTFVSTALNIKGILRYKGASCIFLKPTNEIVMHSALKTPILFVFQLLLNQKILQEYLKNLFRAKAQL